MILAKYMNRLAKQISLLLMPMCLAVSAMGFSLIGQFKNGATPNDWQARGFGGRPAGLGYSLAGDVGGPMTPLEGYRWNVPILTYGFDESFIRYFGPAGEAAVSNAFQILNDLPPFTSMSADLSEFPTDSKQAVSYNAQYGTVGLLDLKSQALAAILEHLGLAKPERFVWGLRGRITGNGFTNYSTVMLNFDPVTLQSSRYVNGIVYSYQIFDALGPVGGEWASAVEFYHPDPYYLPYSAVAGGLGSADFELGEMEGAPTTVVSRLGTGEYYVGLTRDDIGGLRFLYGTNNVVTEPLATTNAVAVISGVLLGNFQSPWQTFFANTNVFIGASNTVFNTNTLATNGLIVQGIRPGINKFLFKRVDFDSLIGQTLVPVTNLYTDTVFTNGRPVIQPLQRASLAPDFLFLVQDLGLIQEVPVTFLRSGTGGWQNNDAINGVSNLGGPGVIQPQVQIFFSDLLPFFLNSDPGFLDEQTGSGSFVWSSFDGTTNPPAIYPAFGNLTWGQLQGRALGQ